MSKPEQVLVFPKELISDWTFTEGLFLGANRDELDSKVNSILYSKQLHYVDRKPAEENEDIKQLIPYCVLFEHTGKVFSYKRSKKGNDNRLHDLWSIGVGGHINPCDGKPDESYDFAMSRELEEEVSFKIDAKAANGKTICVKNDVVGIIYSDRTPVSRVHVGICHFIYLPPEVSLVFKDPALTNGGFEDINVLKKNVDMFEDWSKILISKIL